MFLLSAMADKIFKLALMSKGYRMRLYQAAVDHRLRHSKFGKFALSRLNQFMSEHHYTHSEFMKIAGSDNYQQAFWQSDLGFSWFNNSIGNKNAYFDFALHQISAASLKSVLDVGCGWGAFCASAAALQGVDRVLGIDISDKIIHEAKARYQHEHLHYHVKEIFDIDQQYDILTVFGSCDYISPNQIDAFLERVYNLSSRQIIIVSSLRGIPIQEAQKLLQAVEIKRYDVGYVQPLFHFFSNKKYATLKFEKMGQDSQIIHLIK
jgi:cyclopropane fatty-acyl-phospholipid synthase-like methyltransferase